MNRVENTADDKGTIVNTRHQYRARLIGWVRTDIDHDIALLSVERSFHQRFECRNKLFGWVLSQIASIKGA